MTLMRGDGAGVWLMISPSIWLETRLDVGQALATTRLGLHFVGDKAGLDLPVLQPPPRLGQPLLDQSQRLLHLIRRDRLRRR